jgi:hypothetical protein
MLTNEGKFNAMIFGMLKLEKWGNYSVTTSPIDSYDIMAIIFYNIKIK